MLALAYPSEMNHSRTNRHFKFAQNRFLLPSVAQGVIEVNGTYTIKCVQDAPAANLGRHPPGGHAAKSRRVTRGSGITVTLLAREQLNVLKAALLRCK